MREYIKKKWSEETECEKGQRLHNKRNLMKKKRSEETEIMRQTRLGNAKDSKKRKQSLETDCQRQTRLEKDRLYQKNKRAKRVPLPQNEKSQNDYLHAFDISKNGGIEEQSWAIANINKFHKSVQYIVSQCTVCKEAWPLKSKPRSLYVCSRCSRDKKSPKSFHVITQ